MIRLITPGMPLVAWGIMCFTNGILIRRQKLPLEYFACPTVKIVVTNWISDLQDSRGSFRMRLSCSECKWSYEHTSVGLSCNRGYNILQPVDRKTGEKGIPARADDESCPDHDSGQRLTRLEKVLGDDLV